jgi:NarL family two-component system sensor histidine kinase LiaS
MSFTRRFASLRWKLASSYVAVTLLTVLVLEVVVILAAAWLGPWTAVVWTKHVASNGAKQIAEWVVEPWMADDAARLARVLKQPMGLMIRVIAVDSAMVTDEIGPDQVRVVVGPQGAVVASNWPERFPAGSLFADAELTGAQGLVTEALTGDRTVSYLAGDLDLFVVVVPVVGPEGQQLGALYTRQPLPDAGQWSPLRLGPPLLATTLLSLPCMIPLGLIFGFVTATGLTRRLRRLAQASIALAGGDLSRRARDASGDEIGQLTRQFNAMAGQLEADTRQLHELVEHNARLARVAQKLAALEERHRLAQELHDGVKQYLFGVNLATATALNLLDADPGVARAKLQEAQDLSHQAQSEMQALLNELRPADLDKHGLLVALQNYLDAFAQREDVVVHWQTEGERQLPLIYEQTLFRVAQEALSNVARHAGASQATVELHTGPETVTLRVADDGVGFDPASVRTEATLGLRGMRERLAALDGTLTIQASPGAGTRLCATLPDPTRKEAYDV